jgi:putative hemolysin
MQHYQIDALFGCVSFIGTHIKPLAEHLAFLHHHCSAPANLAPRALAERYVDMNLVDKAMINDKQVMTSLPPLIKGYLRLGGLIGQGAVIDPVYNTTDVSVVVTKANMPPKYFRHYFPAVARQN